MHKRRRPSTKRRAHTRPSRLRHLAGVKAVFCGIGLAAALAMGQSATPAIAQATVDVELVIAVDVSLSMERQERLLQRDGYVAAFRHPDVIHAIEGGLVGRIAAAFVEWAGPEHSQLVVPWTMIANARDAMGFADALTRLPPVPERGTSISGGLEYSRHLFAANDFRGLRKIIDLSGDGPNNMGPPVTEARDRALDEGVTINGLPVQIAGDRFSSYFDIPNLDLYFEDCVIGGAGAFVIAVNDIEQIETAIRRKLVREIAGRRSHLIPAQLKRREPVDCLIGEKMRARRFQFHYER